MTLYETMVNESKELYKSLPEEGNELFKRRFIPIELPQSFGSSTVQEASYDINKLPIKFDAIISGNGCRSMSKAVKIAAAGSEEYMNAISSRIYDTGSDKYSAFINASSSNAVIVNISDPSIKKLNLFFSTNSDICTQVFINAAKNAECEITEWHSSSEHNGSINGVINEIIASPYSRIALNVVHNEPSEAKVLNVSKAVAMSNAHATVNYVYLGGSLTKSRNYLFASGYSAGVVANEFVLAQSEQKYDINTSIVNEAEATSARLTSKAVVSDKSVCFLKGFSKINHGAKDSRSFVEERGLIIEKSAKLESIPSMSIDESQVKASHSSSMAPLDQDTLFYLNSRGIDSKTARMLIISGFSISQLAKISDDMLKVALSSIVSSRSAGIDGIGKIPSIVSRDMWIPSASYTTIQKHKDLEGVQ